MLFFICPRPALSFTLCLPHFDPYLTRTRCSHFRSASSILSHASVPGLIQAGFLHSMEKPCSLQSVRGVEPQNGQGFTAIEEARCFLILRRRRALVDSSQPQLAQLFGVLHVTILLFLQAISILHLLQPMIQKGPPEPALRLASFRMMDISQALLDRS